MRTTMMFPFEMTTRIRTALATTRRRKRMQTPFSSSFSMSATEAATSSYIVVGNGPVGSSVAKHLVALLSESRLESESELERISAGKSNNNDGNSEFRSNAHWRSDPPLVTIVDGRPSGMGSSHADRARLIRTYDAEGDLQWTRWNQHSLEAFPELERVWNDPNHNSNHNNQPRGERKRFFTRCGGLLVGDKDFVERSLRAARGSARTTAQQTFSSSSSSSSSSHYSTDSLVRLSPLECRSRWPYLRPDPGFDEAIFDPSGGLIDPLAFVRAQNHAATAIATANRNPNRRRAAGLEIRPGVVVRISDGGVVELASGDILRATEKVVLCGGAFSNALLDDSGIDRTAPRVPRPVRVSKRTVALLEVSPEVVHGMLRDMPTIKYALGEYSDNDDDFDDFAVCCPDHAPQYRRKHKHKHTNRAKHAILDQSVVEAGSVYVLPPVRYPERDGKWFVKIGGGSNEFFADDRCQREDLEAWLSSGGRGGVSSSTSESSSRLEWLEGILRSLLPGVPLGRAEGMACVTTVEAPMPMPMPMPTDKTGDDIGIDTCVGTGAGVVLNDALLDDRSLVMVSACQGKGAGPADAVGREMARNIILGAR